MAHTFSPAAREAKAAKLKKFHHLEVHKAENGYQVTHHFSDGNGETYRHQPETHVFPDKEGVLEHLDSALEDKAEGE